MTTTVPSRREQIRRFLEENKLEAWIAWRPDELLMLSGYFPFWGASFLLCFLDAEPILYVPQIELREQIPHGLQVRDYPWGDLKCADPYGVLISEIGKELAKRGISTDRVGMVANGVRNSLPIQAGEQ